MDLAATPAGSGCPGPVLVERIVRNVGDAVNHDQANLTVVDKTKEILRRELESSGLLSGP